MELSWTCITSPTATGKRRTRKTTLPVKSSASSTRAIPATTSSSRLRSAPSFIKVARAFSTTTLPAPRPCSLRRPLHHEVGHLPLHLRRSAPPRVPPALRRQFAARVAPHPLRQRDPRG